MSFLSVNVAYDQYSAQPLLLKEVFLYQSNFDEDYQKENPALSQLDIWYVGSQSYEEEVSGR